METPDTLDKNFGHRSLELVLIRTRRNKKGTRVQRPLSKAKQCDESWENPPKKPHRPVRFLWRNWGAIWAIKVRRSQRCLVDLESLMTHDSVHSRVGGAWLRVLQVANLGKSGVKQPGLRVSGVVV